MASHENERTHRRAEIERRYAGVQASGSDDISVSELMEMLRTSSPLLVDVREVGVIQILNLLHQLYETNYN